MKAFIVLLLTVLFAYAVSANEGVCWSTGDPHYKTFDNLYENLYGVQGDFVLAKHEASHFAVQTRLSYSSTWGSNSINTAVVVREKDTVFELTNSYYRINGVKNAALSTSKHLKIVQKGSQFVVSASNGAIVEAHRGSYMNVYVRVPKAFAGKLTGLCGNFNGNANDDRSAFQSKLSQVVPKADDYFNKPELAKTIPEVGTQPWSSESFKEKAHEACKKYVKEEHLIHDCMLDVKVAKDLKAAEGYKQVQDDIKALKEEATKLPKCVKSFIEDGYGGIYKVLRHIRAKLQLQLALLKKQKIAAEKAYQKVLDGHNGTVKKCGEKVAKSKKAEEAAKKAMQEKVKAILAKEPAIHNELAQIKNFMVAISDAQIKYKKPTPKKTTKPAPKKVEPKKEEPKKK